MIYRWVLGIKYFNTSATSVSISHHQCSQAFSHCHLSRKSHSSFCHLDKNISKFGGYSLGLNRKLILMHFLSDFDVASLAPGSRENLAFTATKLYHITKHLKFFQYFNRTNKTMIYVLQSMWLQTDFLY